MQRTSIYLDAPDREALSIIKDAHGIATDAGAIRFAVRATAREIERRRKPISQRSRRSGREIEGEDDTP